MVENIDRVELLERAYELFAISPINNSLEEAAIAARRLKILMDDNDISLSDLKEIQPCD